MVSLYGKGTGCKDPSKPESHIVGRLPIFFHFIACMF